MAQATRLRVGTGPKGESCRDPEEAERAAKEVALARVAELEAELAKLTVRDRRRR